MYKLTPKDARNAITIKRGSNNICIGGRKRNHAINKIINTNEIPKSTRLTITELAGMIMRGKYIFVIRFEFPIRLVLASDKALEKNCQGNTPANTMIA